MWMGEEFEGQLLSLQRQGEEAQVRGAVGAAVCIY